MNLGKYKLILLGLPKSLWFNFHYFPFKIAVKLPILLSHKVKFKSLRGEVILKSKEIKRGLITIGFSDVSINDVSEYSLWNVEGTVVFSGISGFGAGSKIAVGNNAVLTFGENFSITARSEIACYKEITFGDNCLLSWDILIMDTDSHPICDNENNRINYDESIIIGSKVWIGCRSIILKGSSIQDNSIIAAQSVVNKKFHKNFVLIAGQPAKIIKEEITWS